MEHKEYIAGITTYNPNIERLKLNVYSILPQVAKLLLVDNHSANYDDIISSFDKEEKVIIIHNEANMGIAYSMNQIGEYAYKNGYQFFLTLDQDSVSPSNLLDEYSSYVGPSVGIIAPMIEFNQSFIRSLLHMEKKQIAERPLVEKVLYAISSGQLINTKAWKKADGFWNYLFIDFVDQEFCYHLTKLGFSILRINSCQLSHEPGIPLKVLGIPTAKQSAFREYYWARNSHLIYWLYKEQYCNASSSKPYLVVIKRLANALLVREDVVNKISAIFRGVRDAYKWKRKFGKLDRKPYN